MFFILMMVYAILFIVAFWGNYEEEGRKKDYKEYNEIVKGEKNERKR